jgi:hypothetical protein
MADIRRSEEARRARRHENLLSTQGRCAPQVGERVIVVALGPQRDKLAYRKPCRRPVAEPLRHAREGHAERTNPGLDRPGSHTLKVALSRAPAGADGLPATAMLAE